MEEYKKRLLEEFSDLNTKKVKLEGFVGSLKFEELDIPVKLLMKNQLVYMKGYLQTLYDRINLTISALEINEYDKENIKNVSSNVMVSANVSIHPSVLISSSFFFLRAMIKQPHLMNFHNMLRRFFLEPS